MPTHRPRQIDRNTVELLLAGEVPAGTRDGPDPLIDHLAALAAPARSDEIADEPEAIEAFRAGTQTHATARRRPRRRTRSLARLLTAKVTIAAFISATTVGGVALAANTSVLPTPFRLPAKTGPTPPPPPTDADPRTSRPQRNEPGPAGTPSLAELCGAYLRPGGDRLSAPALRSLTDAAGDSEKVAGYCRRLLGAEPGASTTSSASSVSATDVCGRTCAPSSTTWPPRRALREIGPCEVRARRSGGRAASSRERWPLPRRE